MKAITAAQAQTSLERTLKGMIERDVEQVQYFRVRAAHKMYCQLHMRNGYVIEGSSFLVGDGYISVAKEVARKDALQKLIIVVQYNLATELMLDADNHVGEPK
jgi:hypothetical protein